MPVELRKRKAPAEPAPSPPPKKKSNAVKNAASKVKAAVSGHKSARSNGAAETPTVGQTITVEGFGGEIQTNDGANTSLAQLLANSKSGVVLFTYPKASTPGCTKQACLFRDEFTPLTATGFSIYGLSRDSPKANTTFKDKQKLPYPLLCDTSATLVDAIGMKKGSSTTRGVFVVDKAGKVLAAEAGGPDATVEVVRKLVADKGTTQEPSDNVEMTEAPPLPVEDKTEAPAENATKALKETPKEVSSKTPPAAAAEPPREEPHKTESEPIKEVPTSEAASTSAPITPTDKTVPNQPPAPTVETAAPTPVPVNNSEPATTEPVITKEPLAPIAAENGSHAISTEPEKKAEPIVPITESAPVNGAPKESDAAIAKVASDVADSAAAAKIDPATPNPV